MELFRYRADTTELSRPHLVANISLYKDPVELSRLGFPLDEFSQTNAVRQFVFVTASDDNYFHVAMDAIARIQLFFPNHITYFYDLSGGVLDNKADRVSTFLYVIQYVENALILVLYLDRDRSQWLDRAFSNNMIMHQL